MYRKRFWPNHDQFLLLNICLLKDKTRAIDAWQRWKKRVNLDDLDYASFRIMSLAYQRLVELNIDDPDMGRIKGIYRFQWTKNKLAFRGKADLLRAFAEASIPTLLLKGAALSRTVYTDPTARAMHDLDLLVPVPDAAKVVKLLQERGWAAQHFALETIIQYLHACPFLHPKFGELDLHWHVLRSHCETDRDAELWAAAVDYAFDGVPTKILCPADQFLHVCEHGMHHSPTSALQWLVDACFILRHSRIPVDWTRLVDQTRKFRLALPVRKTLSYLRQHFDEPVPDDVMRQLARSPVGLTAHIEYFLAGRPEKKQQDYLHRLGINFCHYLRLNKGRSISQIIRDFPFYVRLVNHYERGLGRAFLEFVPMIGTKCKDRLCGLYFRWDNWRQGNPGMQEKRIADFRNHEIKGCYRQEIIRGQPFRWSEPEASLTLRIPQRDYRLIWEFPAFYPPKNILQHGSVFTINGHPLPAEHPSWMKQSLILQIPSHLLHDYDEQVLAWSIPPLYPGGKDPRVLGLPVFRMWICPRKM